jgi:hypothetical protein
VSGYTRRWYWYGDVLVYEALDTKWNRYHAAHCSGRLCTGDWLDHALERFDLLRYDGGFVALVGPGLTVGHDLLSTDPLWEVVTGVPGRGDGGGWREEAPLTGGLVEPEARRASWKQCGLHRAAEIGYRVEPMHATTPQVPGKRALRS